MRTRFYRLAILSAMLFIAGRATCQSSPKNWVAYYQDEHLLIEVAPAERRDSVNGIFNNYYVLRVTNSTDRRLNVSFRKELEYNLRPVTSDKLSTLTLGPHQMIEGSELPESDKGLRVFINQVDGMNKNVLTGFSITGVQSSEITE